MIVYNVDRCWFPMKEDAEKFRKALGQPPSALHKLVIESREELAVFLNGLMGLDSIDQNLIPAGAPMEPKPAPQEIVERNIIRVPHYVPEFLARSYANGRKIVWIDEDK